MLKKNLEQLRSGLHFSASALKSFLMCPWKFKLQYVEGAVPEFRPSAMVLGRAVHQALAVRLEPQALRGSQLRQRRRHRQTRQRRKGRRPLRHPVGEERGSRCRVGPAALRPRRAGRGDGPGETAP